MRKLSIIPIVLIMMFVAAPLVRAEPFALDVFRSAWERTDLPVQRGIANHSWIWGPEPFTPLLIEPRSGTQEGSLRVQYFDKGRMEAPPSLEELDELWEVTGGLLARELITGQVQTGLEEFVPLAPANISIVGDTTNQFPTYASLVRLYAVPAGRGIGEHVTAAFLPEGARAFEQYAATPETAIVQNIRGFGIPQAFWEYMNQPGIASIDNEFRTVTPLFNWLYVLGYPITDAYWTRVEVGGIERDVLFQAFERRVLTYTPENPPAFQVEMNNIGRHYYQWRYVNPFEDGQQAIITVPASADGPPNVTSPLTVRGFESGAAFEGAITVRLRNQQTGEVIASENVTVNRADVGLAGPFAATLPFNVEQQTPAVIEVVTFSARDGSEMLLTSQEVTLQPQQAGQPPQAIVDRVRSDLANRLGIGPEAVTVVRSEAVEWANAALECPAPDQAYAEVITPGYRIVLEANGQQYEYRTDQNGSVIVWCQDGRPASAGGAGTQTIAWDAAVDLIRSGQVREAFQAHSFEVTLRLGDGRTVRTVEPNIDAVFDVVRECGEPCASIWLATE